MRSFVPLFCVWSLQLVASRVIQKRQSGEPCNSCHQALSNCAQFPFKNRQDQKDIVLWVHCMQEPFEDWRYDTGTEFWPDSQTLVHGPVGEAEMDRQECFDQITQNRECIVCGVQNPLAALNLQVAARDCWQYVDAQNEQNQQLATQQQAQPGLAQSANGHQPHHQNAYLGVHPSLIHQGQVPFDPRVHAVQPQQGQLPLHPNDPRLHGAHPPAGHILVRPDPRLRGALPHQGQILLVHPNDPRLNRAQQAQHPFHPNDPRQHGSVPQQGQILLVHPNDPRLQGQQPTQEERIVYIEVPAGRHPPAQVQGQQFAIQQPQQAGHGRSLPTSVRGAQPEIRQSRIPSLLGPTPDLPLPPERPLIRQQPAQPAVAPIAGPIGLLGPVPELAVPAERPTTNQQPAEQPTGLLGAVPDIQMPQQRPLPPPLPASRPLPPAAIGGLFGPVPDLPLPQSRSINLAATTASNTVKESEETTAKATALMKTDAETIRTTTATTKNEEQSEQISTTIPTTEADTTLANEITTSSTTTTTTTRASTTTKKPKGRRGGRRRGGRRRGGRRNNRRKTTTPRPPPTTTADEGGIDSDSFWSTD